MEKNPFQILENIHTDYQLGNFINQLYLIKKSLFNTTTTYINNPDDYLSKEQQSWLSIGLGSEIELQQSSQLSTNLDKLINNLLHTPKITVTLNKSYSASFIKRIALWIREQTGKPFVISVLIDETIIGGIVIHYMGKYYDYSLRKKIDYLISNRQLSTN